MGEHHIRCAHEAQARRLALGSFFSLGGTLPYLLDERHTPARCATRGPRLRSQHRARRDDTLLAIAPQRDQQLARQRHDANPAEPPAARAKARSIPTSQLTVGLPPHPTPRQFHQNPSDGFQSGATDPFVVPGIAARYGTGTNPLSAPTSLAIPEIAREDFFR